MNNVQFVDGVFEGPWGKGINWSINEPGSIHDDATAAKLGFRGGTVAGDIHMHQFIPVLKQLYGDDWLPVRCEGFQGRRGRSRLDANAAALHEDNLAALRG